MEQQLMEPSPAVLPISNSTLAGVNNNQTLTSNVTIDNTTEALQTSVAEEYIETVIATYIWEIVPPILLILGTVGNVLAIFIFSRKAFRSTISIYLTVLAVSDTLVLYSGLLRQWLYYLLKYDIRSTHIATCKLLAWLIYTALDTSAWIIVALTIERLISVYFPHKVKTFCTRKVCACVLTSVVVLCSLINGHFLIGMEVLEQAVDSYSCATDDADYLRFLEDVWPWIDLCIYSFVPSALIIVGNVLLIQKVFFSNLESQKSIRDKRQRVDRHKKMSSLTTMLISISVFFVVCTTPISIHIILSSYLPEPTPKQQAERSLAWCIENMLMYTGNAFNFILYCFSGSRFRKEFLNVLRTATCRRTSKESKYRKNQSTKNTRSTVTRGTGLSQKNNGSSTSLATSLATSVSNVSLSMTSLETSQQPVSVIDVPYKNLTE